MTVASAVISLLRPQLNDNQAPYRHSDADFLKWLSDGQRLIAQLVPESYPRTELFVPEIEAVRQRLDPASAYNLIRVEQNLSRATTYISDPDFVFAPIRHFPSTDVLLAEYEFITITGVASFPATATEPNALPPNWEDEHRPALILSFQIDADTPVTGLGVSFGGDAMTVVSESRSYVGDDLDTKYIVSGIAIIALDAANPPANNDFVFTGTGTFTTYYAEYGVFNHVDVASTVAGFATAVSDSTAAGGYNVDAGPITVANGDMLITLLGVDWTYIISNTPVRANEIWSPIVPPAYTTNYMFFAVSTGGASIDIGGDIRTPYGINLISHVATPTTSFSDTWHYAFTDLSQFPIGDQASVPAESIGASPLPGYARILRIVAQQDELIPVVTDTEGTIVPSADRDVYDTFDPDWMSRTPDPLPAPGRYFDGFCFDPDDPLGFFLHPKPTSTDDRVYVTYTAVPIELAATSSDLALSDMYIDPLINYAMYRALSAQTQGFSAEGAARAIERFGQQLNLSRETILAFIGEQHRKVEQTQ